MHTQPHTRSHTPSPLIGAFGEHMRLLAGGWMTHTTARRVARFAFGQSGPREVDRHATTKINAGPDWTRRFNIAVDYNYIPSSGQFTESLANIYHVRAFTLLINYARASVEQSKSLGHPFVDLFRWEVLYLAVPLCVHFSFTYVQYMFTNRKHTLRKCNVYDACSSRDMNEAVCTFKLEL